MARYKEYSYEQGKLIPISFAQQIIPVLFWQVGNRINSHILRHKRASYGEQIIVTLSRQLVQAHVATLRKRICAG